METILERKSGSAAFALFLRINDEFRLMGLPPSSRPPATLRARFLQISKLVHPDKCHDSRATEAMQKLTAARDDLSDEMKLPGILLKTGGGPSLYQEAVGFAQAAAALAGLAATAMAEAEAGSEDLSEEDEERQQQQDVEERWTQEQEDSKPKPKAGKVRKTSVLI